MTMDAVLATIIAGGQAQIQLNRKVDKNLWKYCTMTFGGDYSGLYIFSLFCSPST